MLCNEVLLAVEVIQNLHGKVYSYNKSIDINFLDNFEVIREKENLPSFDWRLLNIDFVKEMLVAV